MTDTQKNIKNLYRKKEWDEKKAIIIGASDKDDSIEYYKGIIQYLDKELDKEINLRFEILKSLSKKKEETIKLYESLFRPVLDFISAYGDVLANYSITLDVDYRVNSLV